MWLRHWASQRRTVSEALIYKWQQRTRGKEKDPLSNQASDTLLENQRLLQRINQLETERPARDLKKSPPGGPVEHCQSTDLKSRYELVQELAVATLCSVLEVSRTAYYRYLRGDSLRLSPEKTKYQQLVEQVFAQHKRRYGSRRITAELQQKGYSLGRCQVRTLMKMTGLQAIQRLVLS